MPDAADPTAVYVANAAYAGGFRGQQLIQMTALGLAESEGDPKAHNPKPPDDSYGLWQINYFGDLRQSRTQMFGPPEGLYDPVANAKAAYSLSGGGKTLQPWKADFDNGRYYKMLPRAIAAVTQIGQRGAVGAPNTPPVTGGALGAIGQAAQGASNPGGVAGAVAEPPEGDHCLVTIPLPILPDFCLIDTNRARAVGGVLIIVGGAAVASLGVALLVGRTVNITAVAGKMSPAGWIGALAAHRDDRAVQRARVDSAKVDKEGQKKRARAAAPKPVAPSDDPIHDVPF